MQTSSEAYACDIRYCFSSSRERTLFLLSLKICCNILFPLFAFISHQFRIFHWFANRLDFFSLSSFFNRIKSKDSCYCWYFNFILFQRATFSKSFKYTCNWKPNLECTIGQHRNITTKYNFYLPSKPGNFLFPPHGYSSPFPLQHRHLFMRAAANFLRNSRHL